MSQNTSPDTVTHQQPSASPLTGSMLNKVPEVVLLFWVVKIMSTTVGETAADFLAANVGLSLTTTSLLMAALMAVVLVAQFRARRYVPAVYWLAVVLVSVVGTLITDNLVDNFGVSLWTTTIAFSAALAATFVAWWRSERTLSIHTIVTRRRETFYWLAILCTFALGTSAGDLVAEKLALGYLPSAGLFGLLIAIIALAYAQGGLNPVLAFWAAYVLTRPFGASAGDFLTAAPADGGLGLGTNGTSALFLTVIIGAVAWFTVEQRRADRRVEDVVPEPVG
ncbi:MULTISPECIES: hypothetical protein [Nocardioides]|uniref:Membrane-anchored protein n=1 Tax=Nocardioides vastitatis TaxID=2568655 RepID=A0ABW0ZEA3_9ACTN|nr:hypothetical protein [Nocardioides sp.]